jgi:hypothetical protein
MFFTDKCKRIFFVLFSLVILIGLGSGKVIGQENLGPGASGNENMHADYLLFNLGIIFGKRTPTGSGCRSEATVIGSLSENEITLFVLHGDASGCVKRTTYRGTVDSTCESMTLNWENSGDEGGSGTITWTKKSWREN